MRRLALALVLVGSLSSCGLDVGESRIGPIPECDTSSRGMLILMAQAIPDADYVPCFLAIPDEWRLENAAIESGDVELLVDRDGVGEVEIEMTPSCRPHGPPVAFDGPADVDVFESGAFGLHRWFVFDGGCVYVRSESELDLSAMVDLVSLLSRSELRRLSGLDL